MADKVKLIVAFGAWLVLGILLYAKTFHAPFLFDDEILILRNPMVQDLTHGLASLKNIFSYQPSRIFTNLTVALNFHFCHVDTFGYHVTNWMLHILVTLGVWYFTRQIIAIHKITTQIDVPFWASLLFLVHPLHTESVSYINHRSSVLVTLFYLWSLIFYIKARVGNDGRYFMPACVLAVLSLLSKESGWTLPLVWMLADAMLIKKPTPKIVWGSLLALLVVMFAIFDFKVKQILMTQVYSQSHRGDFLTLGTYLLTQLKVCIVFLRLMFFPVGLNADYDFAISHSLWEPQTMGAAVILMLLAIAAFLWRHRCWYLTWGVAAFFISLLSHFFPARYNVIAEHKLYLTLALIIPVAVLWLHDYSKKYFMVIISVVIAIFAVLTIQRNEVWASPIKLWQDTAKKSPLKPRAHLNLATALLNHGQDKEAEALFFHVIQIAPEYCESYINLAQIETNRGNLEKALAYSNQAIVVNPTFDIGYLQNGFLNDRMGRREAAIKSFSVWLKTHPNDVTISNRVKFLQNQL